MTFQKLLLPNSNLFWWNEQNSFVLIFTGFNVLKVSVKSNKLEI
jgi:hypothetical protein